MAETKGKWPESQSPKLQAIRGLTVTNCNFITPYYSPRNGKTTFCNLKSQNFDKPLVHVMWSLVKSGSATRRNSWAPAIGARGAILAIIIGARHQRRNHAKCNQSGRCHQGGFIVPLGWLHRCHQPLQWLMQEKNWWGTKAANIAIFVIISSRIQVPVHIQDATLASKMFLLL